ncbi:MAG TPA: DUF4188 domain-containing protein [Polyangiales bacterium]|nr:DUF4188 domain-containing protein [Polyangiales bacterium]
MTAHIEGDFVVFLIGARLNKLWKLWDFKWLGEQMQAMVNELSKRPESGFLGYESWVSRSPVMIQYWRSEAQLIAYARQRDATHYPAWVRFNRELAKRENVGIWHETYLIKAGNYECIYNNMPPFGLARVSSMLDAHGTHATSSGRLGKTDGSDAPILPDGSEPA